MDDPRGSVLQILAQYRRILNNVPAEIQSEKLAKGKRNRGFSTIFESKFFFFFFEERGKRNVNDDSTCLLGDDVRNIDINQWTHIFVRAVVTF